MKRAHLNSNLQLAAYEYRVYPNKSQLEYFSKMAGLKRLYENINIDNKIKDDSYKPKTYTYTFNTFKPEATSWLKDVDVVPLNQAWLNLGQSWSKIKENNKKGKWKYEKQQKEFLAGKRKKAPKEFKESKPHFQSKRGGHISFHYNSCEFRNGKLFITRKLGPLSGIYSCRFCKGKIRSCTISRTPTNKWFIKISVEKEKIEKNTNGKTIGIDWNCRDDSFMVMATVNNGKEISTKIKCPRFLSKKAKQLSKQDKGLSRKRMAAFKKLYGYLPNTKNAQDFVKLKAIPYSSNYEKNRYAVAKIYEKVAWQRKDWLHKLSRDLCNRYQYIAFEDINLQLMAKKYKNSGKGHGKVLADQGFGMLRSFCAYKGTIDKVDPANTSKRCHVCGFLDNRVVLGVESWVCPSCGTHHDRDINAALNICSESIVGRERAEITNACGGLLLSSSTKQEASGVISQTENKPREYLTSLV